VFNDSVKKAEEPNKKLNELLKQQELLTLALAKSGNRFNETFKKELDLVNKQIEAYQTLSNTALAMAEAGEQRCDNYIKRISR
jgi:dsDNA-specific endonuclease/ATPase MutS2